jgi:hypothetical protein
MIAVIYDPKRETDPEKAAFWRDWRVKAEAATEKAILSYEAWFQGDRKSGWTFDGTPAIWSELKVWLKTHVFFGKCAYCERRMDGYYGDAEHFRPKGAVKNLDLAGRPRPILCRVPSLSREGQIEISHPGYFWLAYDWRNLVPACPSCNSGTGKKERFDTLSGNTFVTKIDATDCANLPSHLRPRPSKVWKDHYYLPPETLDALEKPLFLFPLNPSSERDPRNHLQFGDMGTIGPRGNSSLGERSIEIFKLRDDDVRRIRQEQQENFRRLLKEKLTELDSAERLPKVNALLNELEQGKYPFSAACLDYYRLYYSALPQPR